MIRLKKAFSVFCATLAGCGPIAAAESSDKPTLELAGITITPHVRAANIRYLSDTNQELGARVEIYLRNPRPASTDKKAAFNLNSVLFEDKEPQRLLQEGDWAWHDTPSIWNEDELAVAPGTIIVLRFNTKTSRWGVGTKFSLKLTDWQNINRLELPMALPAQGVWISAASFLSSDGNAQPDSLIYYLDNQAASAVKVLSTRLYLPESKDKLHLLLPQPLYTKAQTFPADGLIPAGEKGCVKISTGRLPLSVGALNVVLEARGKQFPLWAYLKIKRDTFDISAGPIQDTKMGFNPLTFEPYLKLLKRLHVNTANYVTAPGYADLSGPDGLFTRYPLKFFGRLDPLAVFDNDAMLPFVHGVDCLGEPQNEFAGMPKYPQTALLALQPCQKTRLPATIALTDEAAWRYFAGLADFPSFNAYRVVAPSMDDWPSYNRWEEKPNDKPINWGAPLETIGDLTRNLRELNRPKPIAYTCQGPHLGWDTRDARKHTVPTADEIRLQLYHALANRITSLYWYDLGLRGLVQNRELIEEINRLNREIRMLEDFFIEGDAYRYQRQPAEGKPEWDLSSIISPKGAVLFALDLDYSANRSDKIFEFKRRREAQFAFDLPPFLRQINDVFRVDADGVYPVNYTRTDTGIKIGEKTLKAAIYVASPFTEVRSLIDNKRQALLATEQMVAFDPANKGRDFDVLREALKQK